MLLNIYNKIKSYGFKRIYRVNKNKINKYIFSKRYIYFKKTISQKIKPYPQNYFDNKFLPKYSFNVISNKFKIFNLDINLKNEIDWHQGWPKIFYKKFKIKSETKSFNQFTPDIKMPWEISRLQFLPAISIENNSKLFQKIINSWINENLFLIGVNWTNTMEVAIRAINLIYSFYLFKNKNLIKYKFWKKLINILYQHAIYIENNFEIYYKPNNHYIADLLGYFYLCFFFDHKKKYRKTKIKTYNKLIEQFDLQIQKDGTCYEGSTSYHKLTTEMFVHFYKLCKKNDLYFPRNLKIKLKNALEFTDNCTDFNNNFIQIGDNDSGKILNNFPFKYFNKNKQHLKYYSNFGLTIIKNNNWHITYRHPTYNKKQPTGHFHQDALSVTLSYKGIPILIDPGTYVYTSNKKWRDLMRDYNMHNTFYLKSEKDNLEKQNIFLLDKTEQKDTAQISINDNQIIIKNFAFHCNAQAHRRLNFDNKKIIITDYWKNETKLDSCWNFIFHPQIKLKKVTKNKFEIYNQQKKLLILKSTLNFEHKKAYCSSEYNSVESSSKLFAQSSTKEAKTILYPAKT